MANYIEYKVAIIGGKVITDCGFHIVPIYGTTIISKPEKEWIESNLIGTWTGFPFGIPKIGYSYCFLNEYDAMAFKLRWS